MHFPAGNRHSETPRELIPSLGQILGRLRGEKIEVDAATPATGTIVGVEKRTVPAGENKTVEKEFITLLTGDGLKTLALDTITRIKLVDPRLQAELEKALAVLALGHDNDKKGVTLEFRGQGERKVRVGYVQESPLWKTSYRLVVDDAAAGDRKRTALLQGWAIVENTTDQEVAIYDERVLAKHPLSGLRLVNSTKLNLMQGPVTVFEAGAYAGDARIEDMAAGADWLQRRGHLRDHAYVGLLQCLRLPLFLSLQSSLVSGYSLAQKSYTSA